MNVHDRLIDSHCKPQRCVSINNLNTLWNHRSIQVTDFEV